MTDLRRAARLLVALAVSLLATPGHAAPEGPQDGILQFLQERGLASLPAQAPEMLRQARDAASDLVVSALAFLGVPYRRGGNSANEGFDCSGFTRHVFESTIGLVLPRRADQQAETTALRQVAREELRPGDLVFFNTMRRAFSHVGIYLGEGKFIHAPRPGAEVRVEDMRLAYWVQRFDGARRADWPGASAEAPARP